MEQKIGMEQSGENDHYKEFAEGRKRFAGEIGEHTLDVAKEGKEDKERDLEMAQQHVEAYKKKAEQLRDAIDAKKRGLIAKIINYKQLKELRKDLSRNEDVLREREEEQQWRTEMIGYYDRLIEEEEQMGELMEEAYADNALFDEAKKQELIMEEQGRSVMEQAKKHNVFFVSDIVTADWKPSANNYVIDTKKLDFEDQLNIVLGFEPTIAVSTLSPDSPNRTFGTGAWGVLLAGGRIVGGAESDAGTVAKGLRSRYIDPRRRSVKAIDAAIERPWGGGKEASTSYNELVVEKPEVAGVYFKLESEDIPQDMQQGKEITLPKNYGDMWWGQVGQIMKTGTPLFVIERNNNTVRMIYDVDLENRSFKMTPAYDPENLTNMPGVYKQHTDEAHRRDAVGKVFDKASHLLTEEEREQHEREKDKGDASNFINVY